MKDTDIFIIVVLKEGWTKPKETLKTLENLGLYETNLLEGIDGMTAITGMVHSSRINSLIKADGVDHIGKSLENRCCGGGCGCHEQ